ncbi:MAG: Glycosyl transferase, group 1, partial [candidate division WWE3 bacterium GW2011_GWA1_46_21]
FCTKEVALTQSRKRIKMTEGIPEKKLVVIPNGVEVGKYVIDAITKESAKREVRLKYSIPADAFVFALLGRMSPEKGHLVALRAFTEFLKSNTVADKVYLLFAGGGVLEDVIRKEVSDLGLTTRVAVTGYFDKNDKIKLFSAVDVLLFPSTAEGFGIVMLEGMAFGVPVLCSNLEVLEEVGDGTVMFFEAGNHKNLADKMVGLYSKRDNLGTLIAGARTRVEELYSMERFIDSYNRLYQQLLEDIQ